MVARYFGAGRKVWLEQLQHRKGGSRCHPISDIEQKCFMLAQHFLKVTAHQKIQAVLLLNQMFRQMTCVQPLWNNLSGSKGVESFEKYLNCFSGDRPNNSFNKRRGKCKHKQGMQKIINSFASSDFFCLKVLFEGDSLWKIKWGGGSWIEAVKPRERDKQWPQYSRN